jgi:hypothetical protein
MTNILIEFGHKTNLQILEITPDLLHIVSNSTDLTITDIRTLVYFIHLHEAGNNTTYYHYVNFCKDAKLIVGSMDTYSKCLKRLFDLNLIDENHKLCKEIFYN